jgi:hypothetical protein
MNWCKVCDRKAKYVIVPACFEHELEYVCGYHKRRDHPCINITDQLLKQHYAGAITTFLNAEMPLLKKLRRKNRVKFTGRQVLFPVKTKRNFGWKFEPGEP